MLQFIQAIFAKPLIVVAVTAILLGGGYFLFSTSSGSEAATLTIIREDFKQEVSVSGTVVAAEHVNLGFAESGRISGVYAVVGDKVSLGRVLATIENGELSAAVAQKQAALETEQAKLLSLQNGTRPETIAIDEAAVAKDENALRDSIGSAYVSADDAVHKKADQFFVNPRTSGAVLTFTVGNAVLQSKVEQERIALEPLLVLWGARISDPSFLLTSPETESAKTKQHLIQLATFLSDASEALSHSQTANVAYQTDINTARTTLASALAALTTAEGALAGARGDLALHKAGTTLADLSAQSAQVKAALANVESAKASLARTIVIAPFSGLISKMDVKRGEVVSANTSKISLISTGAFQIETYVPQINVSFVSPGDRATITLDAYGPQVTFNAQVLSVDPAETIREGVATYKTLLVFDSVDSSIRSGMTANVAITTGEKSGAIVIPSGAVTYEGTRAYVTMADGETKREVEVGEASSLGRVEILSGLTVGDVFLLTP